MRVHDAAELVLAESQASHPALARLSRIWKFLFSAPLSDRDTDAG